MPPTSRRLSVQFQGDAQIQVDVERVVVRDERPGRGAAGDGVQRRRLDFPDSPDRRDSGELCGQSECACERGPAFPGCRSDRDSDAADETRCPACRLCLSGCGCKDLPRNVSSSAKTVGSPVLRLAERTVHAERGRPGRDSWASFQPTSPICFWPMYTCNFPPVLSAAVSSRTDDPLHLRRRGAARCGRRCAPWAAGLQEDRPAGLQHLADGLKPSKRPPHGSRPRSSIAA